MTTPSQDDPADTLAKDIISRFCTTTNKFMQNRVAAPFVQNPLMGLRLPYAPLAAEIRKVASLVAKVQEKELPPLPDANWFGDQPSPDSTGSTQQPLSDRVAAFVGDRKARLGEIAEALSTTTDAIREAITANPDVLTINGPGWVQKTA